MTPSASAAARRSRLAPQKANVVIRCGGDRRHRKRGRIQNGHISINTLPSAIIERIRQNDTAFAKRIASSFELRAKARTNVLLAHTIYRHHVLPDLATVLAGREPIPGAVSMGKILYDTQEEYRLHLMRILWHLDVYIFYQTLFTDDPINRSAILFVKGTARAPLVKTAAPFTVFDITEPTMSAAFCDYLRRNAEERTPPTRAE